MPAFTAKYTAAQREAAAIAYVDLGMRPAKRVSDAAKAGQLRLGDDEVGAFSIPPPSVLDLARKLRQRRAGKVSSELAKAPARDAAEALKRALAAMTEQEIAHEKRKRIGNRDPERIRQLARAAREIAAIPDRADSNPRSPGKRDPETGAMRNGGQTEGGLAGAILSAAGQGAARARSNAGQAPAQDAPRTHRRNTEKGSAAEREQRNEQDVEREQGGGPGSWARETARVLEGAT